MENPQDTADRLRLDVAVSGDSEMFSWAGENHFQDGTLADLVRSGATSTGTFSSFLGSIFGTDAATFTYNGDVDTAGRLLAEFGFRVPSKRANILSGTSCFTPSWDTMARSWWIRRASILCDSQSMPIAFPQPQCL